MNFGIKKLDSLIIKSFLGPFIVTFFIVLFVFLMQFFWLYMDDLIGKGLGAGLLLELMFYYSAALVPMALPLGILLAAIMTFGNLGENYELVAIKSAGISLFRFMRPLIIFITIVSVGAFFFSNYVIPKANLKAYSLLYDMRNKKPTMNIKPGIFNRGIGNFAIRVGSKSKDGVNIKDILIYDHSSGYGNNNVVAAESGRMFLSGDKRFLIFELNNGWRYEMKRDDTGSYEQQRMFFKQWNKVLDVSGFGFSRTKEELFNSNEEMMDVQKLSRNKDSVTKVINRDENEMVKNNGQYLSLQGLHGKTLREKIEKLEDEQKSSYTYREALLIAYPDSIRNDLVSRVINNAQSSFRYTSIFSTNKDINESRLNNISVEFHRKFTLSFACLLLFLIGAPLGAIIRKGGIGMPMVISVVFFVIYFIMSSTGEKLAKQGKLPVMQGMWLATALLLPIAILIMVQARNDSAVFKIETYKVWWERIKRFFSRKKLLAKDGAINQ